MSDDSDLEWFLPPTAVNKESKGFQSGEIDHKDIMSKNMASMFLCRDLSDVTFMVEEEEFPAHKAMFLGGLKENNDDKVVLKETSGFAFRALLW
ncbi:unnamed protein product [Haemonchus placei]|uniref:BTB domain-containing protein n=1 Tax=Haemonchus placei TaxID=6290 RepID=A0A0N4WD88_HAEPC|nr:unnamed protein product [Haemonchus placei]